MNTQDSTLNYYDNNAQEFVENTFSVDTTETITRFVKKIPFGGEILDVGCGSGRDSKCFLELGYKVTAFDASKEIANIAAEKISHPVLHLQVQEITWENKFDGVWAMASLLHLPKDDIPNAIEKCIGALKEGGTFFASFKSGEGESFDNKGRYFSYFNIEELNSIMENIPEINNFKVSYSGTEDALKRDVTWINIIAIKEPALILNKTTKHKFN